jgi:primary-amine oxidase
VINYKLDMDINGTANSLEKVEVVPTTTNYTWLAEQRNTMKIERSFIETEDDGKINW